MEQDSLLSLVFYENEIVKSYNCYLMDDDQIEITLSYDSVITGSVKLNSAQFKSILNLLDNVNDDSIEIDDVMIKKSYLQNLKPIVGEN